MPDSDLFVGPGGPSWHQWGDRSNTNLDPELKLKSRQGQLKLKVNPLDLDYWPYGSLIVRVISALVMMEKINFFFKYLHCLMSVSMRQFSSNILNFFFPGLGWPSHLSWVTWKETNLKMKLLTETERSGCADASPWRVLMFLKIFSSSILSSVEYLLTWSGYKSRWML